MKIYLAGNTSRAFELRTYASMLETRKHIITSRWLWYATTPSIQTVAEHALENITMSDAVICFTRDKQGSRKRGGRHVEFGIGLALGKRVFIVGDQENVFHHLKHVRHFDEFGDLLAHFDKHTDTQLLTDSTSVLRAECRACMKPDCPKDCPLEKKG